MDGLFTPLDGPQQQRKFPTSGLMPGGSRQVMLALPQPAWREHPAA